MPHLRELLPYAEKAPKLRDPKLIWAEEVVARSSIGQPSFSPEHRHYWINWVQRGREVCGEDTKYHLRIVKSRALSAMGYNSSYIGFKETAKAMAQEAGISLHDRR